jgi:GGDEF domain-containing protein
MGGDEFVIVAPGLSAEAAEARGICLSALAKRAGEEICGVNWLSLSVGWAISSADGMDAEKLLSEADHRMYSQKQDHHLAMKGLAIPPRDNTLTRNAVAH